jgi:hypothetical protein
MAEYLKMMSVNRSIQTNKIDTKQQEKNIQNQQNETLVSKKNQESTKVNISVEGRKLEEKNREKQIQIDQNMNNIAQFHKVEMKQIEKNAIKSYQSIANM